MCDSVRMSEKDEAQSVWCEVCNLSVNSQQQYLAHLEGKSHKKKLAASGQVNTGQVAVSPKTKQLPHLICPFKPALDEGCPATQSHDETDTVCLSKPGRKRKAETYLCAVCDLGFNSEEQASSHFSGSKHAKKLKAVESMDEVLKTGFVSPLSPPPPPPTEIKQSVIPPPPSVSSSTGFFCSFCDMQLNSPQQLAQHREGSKHNKQVRLKSQVAGVSNVSANPEPSDSPVEKTKQFTCDSCCMAMNNDEDFKKHNNSQGHWSRLKELIDHSKEFSNPDF